MGVGPKRDASYAAGGEAQAQAEKAAGMFRRCEHRRVVTAADDGGKGWKQARRGRERAHVCDAMEVDNSPVHRPASPEVQTRRLEVRIRSPLTDIH